MFRKYVSIGLHCKKSVSILYYCKTQHRSIDHLEIEIQLLYNLDTMTTTMPPPQQQRRPQLEKTRSTRSISLIGEWCPEEEGLDSFPTDTVLKYHRHRLTCNNKHISDEYHFLILVIITIDGQSYQQHQLILIISEDRRCRQAITRTPDKYKSQSSTQLIQCYIDKKMNVGIIIIIIIMSMVQIDPLIVGEG